MSSKDMVLVTGVSGNLGTRLLPLLSDYRVVGESLWLRFHGGKQGTLWYYRSVADALRDSGRTPLIDELRRVVTEIEQLAH